MTQISIRGGRQLRATLKTAGADLSDLRRSHLSAAGVVVTAAQPAAPVRSGRLAASVRPGATQRAAIIRAGSAGLPYAGPIHWGWPRRHITAQPFIATQAQATEPQWLAIYQSELDSIVSKIKGI